MTISIKYMGALGRNIYEWFLFPMFYGRIMEDECKKRQEST